MRSTRARLEALEGLLHLGPPACACETSRPPVGVLIEEGDGRTYQHPEHAAAFAWACPVHGAVGPGVVVTCKRFTTGVAHAA